MFPTRKISILAVAGSLLLLSVASSRVALAQNTYNVTYYNTDPTDIAIAELLGAHFLFTYPIFDVSMAEGPLFGIPNVDNTIRMVNPTFHANGVPGLCAFIYVFDDDEEPIECCGCPISNDGELTLSVIENLTSNPEFLPPDHLRNTHGVIEVVSGLPNAPASLGFCDPTGLSGSIVPTANIRSWIDHGPAELTTNYPPLNTGTLIGAIDSTEVPFLAAPLNSLHLGDIELDCQFILQNGTHQGLCSCEDAGGHEPTVTPPMQTFTFE